MGAWFGYGLGSECRDLPGFIVLNGGLIPPGGLDNFNSGFLPATYQGSIFHRRQSAGGEHRPAGGDRPACSGTSWRCSSSSTPQVAERLGRVDAVESAIANYELAYRMQTAVPGPDGHEGRDRGDAAAVRPGRHDARAPRRSPGSACSPGGWSSAACGSSS